MPQLRASLPRALPASPDTHGGAVGPPTISPNDTTARPHPGPALRPCQSRDLDLVPRRHCSAAAEPACGSGPSHAGGSCPPRAWSTLLVCAVPVSIWPSGPLKGVQVPQARGRQSPEAPPCGHSSCPEGLGVERRPGFVQGLEVTTPEVGPPGTPHSRGPCSALLARALSPAGAPSPCVPRVCWTGRGGLCRGSGQSRGGETGDPGTPGGPTSWKPRWRGGGRGAAWGPGS